MVSLLRVGWDCCTETKDRDLLVTIIVLEDRAYRLDGIQVLVPLHVEVVKGIALAWVSIGKGEVDGDTETYLTASEDILQEGVSLLDL